MKKLCSAQFLFCLLTILFLILVLLFPSQTRLGASNGLLLWFNTLLPTLLPFFILSDLVRRLGIFDTVCRRLIARTGKNLYFLYPLTLGLLCGLPLGAKLTAESVRSGQLSRKHGQFLLTACNNSSTMFLIGYVCDTQLNRPELSLQFLLFIPPASFLAAFIVSLPELIHPAQLTASAAKNPIHATSAPGFFTHVSNSIMDSFTVITQIGGFVILFSILSEFVLLLDSPFMLPLVAFSEMTTGIRAVCASDLTQTSKVLLSAASVSFTGLSGIAQTACVIQDSGLSLPAYIVSRILSAIITLGMFCLVL